MRSLVYRLIRYLYHYLRYDSNNNPSENGEYMLLDILSKSSEGGDIFIDIGSNVGDWTGKLIEKNTGKINKYYAFEACRETFQHLQERFKMMPEVHVFYQAVSDSNGIVEFYSSGVKSGTNSLSKISGNKVESVNCTTLDNFFVENNITHAKMVKIDIEGFDYNVLLGMYDIVNNNKVDIVQFEYNWRWLINGRSLYDVFELMKNTKYRIAKLHKRNILVIDKWHPDLDKYTEGNYLIFNDTVLNTKYKKKYSYDKFNSPTVY